MLTPFKSTKIMFCVLVLLGYFLISLFSNTTSGEQILTIQIAPVLPLSLGTLFLFLWFFIVLFIVHLVADKKMEKINNIMVNECNLQKYIDIINGFLKKRLNIDTKTLLLLNLSSGYLNIGNSMMARHTLGYINHFPNNRTGAINKVCYFNNLASYYLQVNDILNATRCLEKMKTALQNNKLSESNRYIFFNLYNDKQFLLNIENGNYDGCEQVFDITFEREKSVLGKVFAKFTLGRIYLHYDRLNEAKQAFEYVINNGGTSHYVGEAKVFLNQLNTVEQV